MQGLVLGEALFALLQQDLGLLDGFFAVLQLLAQCADLRVIEGQQACKACVIQFRVQGTPFADAAGERVLLGLQRLLALLLRLEVGGQLDQAIARVLQLLAGIGLALA